MHKDIEKILFDRETISNRVKELAKEITEDYKGKDLVCICLLKGGVLFLTDLIKEIDLDLEIDFMDVSSYGASTTSSGEVRILKDLDASVNDRDLLIVEDIIDTGVTLSKVVELLKSRQAKSIEIVSFLNKPDRRKIDMDVKYIGYEIPDYFVVGYGLDFDEKYRNLPYIGYLKEELYK
ncbi:hypoxanthine phosphoribosyltransferase [Neofamilia massiliensis]|uniref:hypoxanthine phosphoribosyltransferase n=1 Tax=Neofamilia massiliensis TaxID=1673724 RepID=UPI0006BB9861|nr:hypoxanthine phosphoribosyltransferase [Neofamilia massiliensis]